MGRPCVKNYDTQLPVLSIKNFKRIEILSLILGKISGTNSHNNQETFPSTNLEKPAIFQDISMNF